MNNRVIVHTNTDTEIYPKMKIIEIDNSTFNISGQKKYMNSDETGRGVIIHIKNNINRSSVEIKARTIEFIWNEIKLNDKENMIIGCI